MGQNQEQMLFRTQAYASVRSLFCFQTVRLACLKHYFRDIFQIAHHSSRHWGFHFHSSFSNLDQLSKLKVNGKLHFLDKSFCNQVQIFYEFDIYVHDHAPNTLRMFSMYINYYSWCDFSLSRKLNVGFFHDCSLCEISVKLYVFIQVLEILTHFQGQRRILNG